MFAGKSEELLRKINRLKYADVDFLLFKPKIDTRTKNKVKSRDGRANNAIIISRAEEILMHVKNKPNITVLAIDEAQFFDESLGEICDRLANSGKIIYVAGLDLNFKGEPFKSISSVMSYAEKIIKLTAICTECGAPATRSQRLINNKPADVDSPIVQIGNTESYAARCRHHHFVPNKSKI
jgi:thymidine kinase